MEKQRIALEGVLEMVESEVSKVAARAFAQIGEAEAKVALYDSIRIKSSDKSTLEAMFEDTMSEFVLANVDFCRPDPERGGVIMDLPDIDASTEQMCEDLLLRYLQLGICAEWFADRYAEVAEEYRNRTLRALESLTGLLRSRKPLSDTNFWAGNSERFT